MMIALKVTASCEMELVSAENVNLLDFCESQIGCDIPEFVHPMRLPCPYVMAIDESGLSKRLPMNPLGSWLYQTDIHGHPIVGDLLFFKDVMTSDGPSYDSLNVTEVLKLETLFDKVIGDLKEGRVPDAIL